MDSLKENLKCVDYPEFSVICSFLGNFSSLFNFVFPTYTKLSEMLEDLNTVDSILILLHVKLLRNLRRSVKPDEWEKRLVTYTRRWSEEYAWFLETYGYLKCSLIVKLNILKNLCEDQFDKCKRLKDAINRKSSHELRMQPLGRDFHGNIYWFQMDSDCQIFVYKEDVEEQTWSIVARNRDTLVATIDDLQSMNFHTPCDITMPSPDSSNVCPTNLLFKGSSLETQSAFDATKLSFSCSALMGERTSFDTPTNYVDNESVSRQLSNIETVSTDMVMERTPTAEGESQVIDGSNDNNLLPNNGNQKSSDIRSSSTVFELQCADNNTVSTYSVVQMDSSFTDTDRGLAQELTANTRTDLYAEALQDKKCGVTDNVMTIPTTLHCDSSKPINSQVDSIEATIDTQVLFTSVATDENESRPLNTDSEATDDILANMTADENKNLYDKKTSTSKDLLLPDETTHTGEKLSSSDETTNKDELLSSDVKTTNKDELLSSDVKTTNKDELLFSDVIAETDEKILLCDKPLDTGEKLLVPDHKAIDDDGKLGSHNLSDTDEKLLSFDEKGLNNEVKFLSNVIEHTDNLESSPENTINDKELVLNEATHTTMILPLSDDTTHVDGETKNTDIITLLADELTPKDDISLTTDTDRALLESDQADNVALLLNKTTSTDTKAIRSDPTMNTDEKSPLNDETTRTNCIPLLSCDVKVYKKVDDCIENSLQFSDESHMDSTQKILDSNQNCLLSDYGNDDVSESAVSSEREETLEHVMEVDGVGEGEDCMAGNVDGDYMNQSKDSEQNSKCVKTLKIDRMKNTQLQDSDTDIAVNDDLQRECSKQHQPRRRSSRVAEIMKREQQKHEIEHSQRLVELSEIADYQRAKKRKRECNKTRMLVVRKLKELRKNSNNKAHGSKRKKRAHTQHLTADDEGQASYKKHGRRHKHKNRNKRGRKPKHGSAKLNTSNKVWQHLSDSSSLSSFTTELVKANNEDLFDDDDIYMVCGVRNDEHEFSPESDFHIDGALLDADCCSPVSWLAERLPVARVCRCVKCRGEDHREQMLVCTGTDCGDCWHFSCLRPALFVCPEFDWLCPVCEHKLLIGNLQSSVTDYDLASKQKANDLIRQKRLEYVNLSMDSSTLSCNQSSKVKITSSTPENSSQYSSSSSSAGSDADPSSAGSDEDSMDGSDEEGTMDDEDSLEESEQKWRNAYKSDMDDDGDDEELESMNTAGYSLRKRVSNERQQMLNERVNTFDRLICEAIQDEVESHKEHAEKYSCYNLTTDLMEGEPSLDDASKGDADKRRRRRFSNLDELSDVENDLHTSDSSFHASDVSANTDDYSEYETSRQRLNLADDKDFVVDSSNSDDGSIDSLIVSRKRRRLINSTTKRSRREATSDSEESDWRPTRSRRNVCRSSVNSKGGRRKTSKRDSTRRRPFGNRRGRPRVRELSPIDDVTHQEQYMSECRGEGSKGGRRKTRGKFRSYAELMKSDTDSDTLNPILPAQSQIHVSSGSGEEFMPSADEMLEVDAANNVANEDSVLNDDHTIIR